MRVLSFGMHAPYEGVPHAGGEYYLRHVRSLVDAGHQVVVVVPATLENLQAVGREPEGVPVLLVDGIRTVRSRVGDRVVELLRHAVPPARFASAMTGDPRVVAAIHDADLIEYQWVQAAALARRVARTAGRPIPSVCIAHDVLSQALRRQSRQRGLSAAKRALRGVRAAVGGLEERRNLRRIDLLLTFSDKDRALLSTLGPRVEVIAPPLADSGDLGTRAPAEPPVVLFVGAFDRIENYDAAHWLLEMIWPIVLRARPDARLELVGANPSAAMTAAADPPRVVVSGYVDDIDPYYRRATAALVPLRLGAGVKFKVVAAMLHAVPIVTTSVGAEGIDDVHLLAGVTDDPAGLAAAVLAVLEHPEASRPGALAARASAEQRYGRAGFQRRLDLLYRGLVAGSSGEAAPDDVRADA